MKTAIKPKDFDLKSALYSLRRVYWHNVFVINGMSNYGVITETRKNAKMQVLLDLNEWILQQIKGIQRQLNP